MTASPVPYVSEEDYLSGEHRNERRHEYYNGRLRALADPSRAHETVAGNLFALLWNHLRGKSCQPFKGDMKVRLTVAGKSLYYYPDVMVACDPADSHPLYADRPKLIIEVLSDNEDKDLVEKLLAYQRIASLEEYVVASQKSEAPFVYIFRRSNGWEPAEVHTGMDAEFTLQSVALTLRVGDLFSV